MKRTGIATLLLWTVLSVAAPIRPVATQGEWFLENNAPAALSDRDGLELTLKKESANKNLRILLKRPVPIDDADTLQFFYNMPFVYGPDYAHDISVLLKDSAGKESLLPAGRTLNTHFAPGNARRTAYWTHAEVDVSGKKNAEFIGIEVRYQHWNTKSEPKASRLCFRDFALTNIRYDKAKLYYALSNFRGNFNNPAFNGCAGRFLTDLTGGSSLPFLFLDNAVDHVKSQRPARLDLRFDLFDGNDRRIWSAEHKGIPAKTPADSARRFEIPLTRPGTYRLRAKSYDSATGRFFTQEWVRLVILRGDGKVPESALPERLAINPETPWGVLKKQENLQFHVNGLDHADWVLKWGYRKFTFHPCGFAAEQPYTVKETIPLKPGGAVFQRPFTASGDDLVTVTAELWRNGVRVERVEREMGIANSIPPGRREKTENASPTVADAFRENGGVWQNLQLHAFEVITEQKKWLGKNIGELKKVSPWLGFHVTPDLFEPLPGVYHWKPLEELLDIAAKHKVRIVFYLAEKYPPEWAQVRFYVEENGKAHNSRIVWKYLKGGYNYATGEGAPELIREFNIQLARRFRNHPGLGAYYFENEHIVSDGSSLALATSHDAGNLRNYRAHLKNKYRKIAALNRAYGTGFSSFDAILLPSSDRKRGESNLWKLAYQDYVLNSACEFIRNCQLDPVRQEDASRPILIYAPAMLRTVDAGFYEHLAKNGAILANGGVHSWLDQMIFREAYNAIPGLLERMEPHGMFSYAPEKYGLDDMIFGMLAMGGRGLNFHYFYRAVPWEDFRYETYLNAKNPHANGFRILKEHFPAILELKDVEVFHDPVGILELPSAAAFTYLPHWANIRGLMTGLHEIHHYKPKVRTIGGRMSYLNGTRILFVCGHLIQDGEIDYLRDYLAKGGTVVLEHDAASLRFSGPDAGKNVLLTEVKAKKGSDVLSGQCETYTSGKGRIFRMKRGVDWRKQKWIPSLLSLAGISSRIYDSNDPCLQVHPLRKGSTIYFAVTHRGNDPRSGINGPRSVKDVRISLFQFDPGKRYALQDIWTPGAEERILSGTDMKNGFNAGNFEEGQMKIFRIRQVQ